MKNRQTNNWIQKATMVATTGAIAVIPFLGTSAPVEAQPRGNAAGWNNNKQTSLVGTVTRDLAGDNFELRTGNGQIYRVRVGRYDEPRSIDRGDQVQVTGRFQSNVFVANNVKFLRDTRNNDFDRDTLTGTVSRDLSGNNFELRASDGRTYRVRLDRQDEPRSLDRGDRVRLTGRLSDNKVFVARRIQFLNDTPGNNGNFQTVAGTVGRDLADNEFQLRDGTGEVYRVRYDQDDTPRRLRRGDRVQVIGRVTGNIVIADSVKFLTNGRLR